MFIIRRESRHGVFYMQRSIREWITDRTRASQFATRADAKKVIEQYRKEMQGFACNESFEVCLILHDQP